MKLECKKHGLVEHGNYVSDTKGNRRWRCRKCLVEAVVNRRRVLKEKAVEYLGGNCVKCLYNKCIDALEFHHIDPKKKDFGISKDGFTRSWKKIQVELDKCLLVCSNCHREIHHDLNL